MKSIKVSLFHSVLRALSLILLNTQGFFTLHKKILKPSREFSDNFLECFQWKKKDPWFDCTLQSCRTLEKLNFFPLIFRPLSMGNNRSHNDYCQQICTSSSTISNRDIKTNWILRRVIRLVTRINLRYSKLNYCETLSSIIQGDGHRQVRPRLVERQMSRENRILSFEVLRKIGSWREASASDA